MSDVERARDRIAKRKAARAAAAAEEKALAAPRRKSGWDQAPEGYEGMSVGQVAAQAPELLMKPITNVVVKAFSYFVCFFLFFP
jgi:hypothetical protein